MKTTRFKITEVSDGKIGVADLDHPEDTRTMYLKGRDIEEVIDQYQVDDEIEVQLNEPTIVSITKDGETYRLPAAFGTFTQPNRLVVLQTPRKAEKPAKPKAVKGTIAPCHQWPA